MPTSLALRPPLAVLCALNLLAWAALAPNAHAQQLRLPQPAGAPGTAGAPAPLPPANAAPAQAAAPAASAAVNPVALALEKAGVKRCAGQVRKVTQFLTAGSRSGTTIFPSAANPDDSLLSISSELITGDVLSYAEANFAPRADGCSAMYEHVAHWKEGCDAVHAAKYRDFKPQGVMQQYIKVYYNTPSVRLMMVPAGTGCVVIKKEVLH